MYLDYAENQARRQNVMRMADWSSKLDAFLEFNEYPILKNLGKVKGKTAKLLAERQYETFRVRQDQEFKSDFDVLVEESKKLGEGD